MNSGLLVMFININYKDRKRLTKYFYKSTQSDSRRQSIFYGRRRRYLQRRADVVGHKVVVYSFLVMSVR